MKRPCPISLCECPGVDTPITNISAEAPDPLLFWGQIWNPNNSYSPAVLDNTLDTKTDCANFLSEIFSLYDPIVYSETQLMADLMAKAKELGCPWPAQSPGTIFTNDEKTATVFCANGASFSYTIAAGTLTSPEMDDEFGAAWLFWANAWAESYALKEASALKVCIEEETPDPDNPTPPDPDYPDVPVPPVVPLVPPGTILPAVPLSPDYPPGPGVLPELIWVCKDEEVYHTYFLNGPSTTVYSFSIVSGELPPGTTLIQSGPRKVVLYGYPTTAGEYLFKIRAVSVSSPLLTGEVWASVFVFGLVTSSIPDLEIGIYYSYTLVADGGTAPYTFALDSGSSLPAGLSLASDGTISGTPTGGGDSTFDVVITDANGGYCVNTVSMVTCPDWALLAWGVATQSNGTFTPSSAASDSFTGQIVGPLPASVGNAGYIDYNGGGCDCNMHIVYTGVPTSGSGWCSVSADQVAPYVPLFCWDGLVVRNPGTYDIPFSLPDTGGVSRQFRIIVNMPALAIGESIVGTVSNVT